MTHLITAILMVVLVLVAEKAILFHVKLYLSVALDDHGKVDDPSLIKPVWRLAAYLAIAAIGVSVSSMMLDRFIGTAFFIAITIGLVLLDLRELRRLWSERK